MKEVSLPKCANVVKNEQLIGACSAPQARATPREDESKNCALDVDFFSATEWKLLSLGAERFFRAAVPTG